VTPHSNIRVLALEPLHNIDARIGDRWRAPRAAGSAHAVYAVLPKAETSALCAFQTSTRTKSRDPAKLSQASALRHGSSFLPHRAVSARVGLITDYGHFSTSERLLSTSFRYVHVRILNQQEHIPARRHIADFIPDGSRRRWS
jgi:hypothetical protein